ncbi:hypothetical protein Vretifemale_16594 [Volvox reticuliferus]|uniref:Uncharacterized protein n=1 Tax=Volvox reticuliferus TaxID=1737510 RepID=A0A8J4CU48_9CHLO|nr:hypothetical protein Vretifemale_16594 [Volvox reticuliferus]
MFPLCAFTAYCGCSCRWKSMTFASAPILGHAHQAMMMIFVASVVTAFGIFRKVGEPFWVRVRRRPHRKEARCRRGTPLGNVVSDCEARWLLEDLQASRACVLTRNPFS